MLLRISKSDSLIETRKFVYFTGRFIGGYVLRRPPLLLFLFIVHCDLFLTLFYHSRNNNYHNDHYGDTYDPRPHELSSFRYFCSNGTVYFLRFLTMVVITPPDMAKAAKPITQGHILFPPSFYYFCVLAL